MLPDPLHPALVHFPIALALLAPLLAAGFLIAIQTRRLPTRAWLAVVALQIAIVGFGWVTAETGEEEEERVERVVAEDPIEEHEEAAEAFLWVSGVAVPIAAIGLLPGGIGTAARVLALIASLAAGAAVARVGHTGGLLVYEHGAAIAYLDGAAGAEALGRSVIGELLSGARAGSQQRDGSAGDGDSRGRGRGRGD